MITSSTRCRRTQKRSTQRQQGLATVETAIIASLMFVMIFAIVEFGRLLWVWGTLGEATRRGARIAAVCPPFGTGISASKNGAALLPPNGSGGGVLPNFTGNNINIAYLDPAGTPLTPVNCDNIKDVRYVRASVNQASGSEYLVKLNVPLFDLEFKAPEFATTFPAENLGVYRPEALHTGMDPLLLYCDFNINGTLYSISEACPP